MENTDRWYIRCSDCLSIGVLEQPFERGWHCNLCAGAIELMGKVVEDRRVEVEHERSACDKRCTHAVGPICVCKCNCANHGTGRIVKLVRVENIQQVQFISDDKALAEVKEYHLMTVALHGLYDVWGKLRADAAIPYEQRVPYNNTWGLLDAIKKYKGARTWKARHKHLDSAMALVQSSELRVANARQGGL